MEKDFRIKVYACTCKPTPDQDTTPLHRVFSSNEFPFYRLKW